MNIVLNLFFYNMKKKLMKTWIVNFYNTVNGDLEFLIAILADTININFVEG